MKTLQIFIAKVCFFLILTLFIIACSSEESPIVNNNKINLPETVTIGNQVWKTKNLDVEFYRNGDSIPYVPEAEIWDTLTTGAWCYYNNNPALGFVYGKLYNWYALNDNRGLTPVGWHVPSDEEWLSLINYLGGESIVGGKLKEKGTEHWLYPNTDAVNDVNFYALPGGLRFDIGKYDNIGSFSFFWSLTQKENDSEFSWSWRINYVNGVIAHYYFSKAHGLSVRCVKD